MAKLANLARMVVVGGGTGPLTLTAAAPVSLTFAEAGVMDGDVVSYAIRTEDAAEVGYGTYSAGVLERTTVIDSTSGGNPIDVSGAGEVFITLLAEDLSTLAQTGHWDDLEGVPATFPPSAHTHPLAQIDGLAAALNDKANTSDISDVGYSGDWNDLHSVPTNFPPSSHTHPITQVDGLQTALNAKADDADISAVGKSGAWADVTGKPATFPPSSHTHTIAQVDGLQTALNAKADDADISAVGKSGAWADVTGKPSTFPPAAHTHTIAQVDGLQTALNAKADDSAISDVGKTGDWSDVTGKPATFPPAAHTHTIAQVDGLQTALNAKADDDDISAVGKTGDWSDIVGVPVSFPPSAHTHTIAQVDGLQTALDGKAGTAVATTSANGLMSSADKTKLNKYPTTPGNVGVSLMESASSSAAQIAMKGGTTGRVIFEASTQGAAQNAMGGTTTGKSLFTTSTPATARATLEAQQDLQKVRAVELGQNAGAAGAAFIDFHTSTGASDYHSRIIRNSGVNGDFVIANSGAGAIQFATTGAITHEFPPNGRIWCRSPDPGGGGTTGFAVINSQGTFGDFTWDGGVALHLVISGTTVSWVPTISDEKHKENITETEVDALGQINQLRYVEFDWKPDFIMKGHVPIGLVAQEVQEVAPNLVVEGETLSLNSNSLIHTLGRAIQQLTAQVEDLKQELAALKNG